MKGNRLLQLVVVTLLTTTAAPVVGATGELHLEVGDPARKGQEVHLVLDAITDSRSGELLSPNELAARLADKRLVLIGESHLNMDSHRVQGRLIRALHEAGRRVMLGLEMYPYTSQEHLDAWVEGSLSEESFVERSHWYDTWGAHWNYYREIFVFAKDHGLPIYALNTPREVVAAVRMKGLDELNPEERKHLPPTVDTDSAEHFRLFKAFFEDEEGFHSSMTEEQWQAMFNAQCAWDATFGHRALAALKEHPAPEVVLVVLVGSGHVAYGLGIQRQVANWSDVAVAAVIPVPVLTGDDEAVEAVRASYADFVWGLPPETDPIYPTLGISTTRETDGRRRVIHVGEDSVGEMAGLLLGDILVAMDGVAVADKETLARLVARKRWGDVSRLEVERGDEKVELEVAFRRRLDDGKGTGSP